MSDLCIKPHYPKPEKGLCIVSIKLWGGLCNRLFQIACCLGYAEKYNLSPVFYKCLFEHNKHEYEYQTQNTNGENTITILKELLPELDIRDDVVSESDFYIIDIGGDFACKYIDLQLPLHTYKNILLKGYFQSEQYFPILESNKFLYPFVKKIITDDAIYQNAENAENANNKYDKYDNLYFLHIRMGDYMNHYLHYLGYKKYLETSIKYILDRNPNAVFLICSNEKDKTKILQELDFGTRNKNENNLLSRIKYEFEIDINPDINPLDTLKNMSMCAGGICMNSSFSWFGAYLSRVTSKYKLLLEHCKDNYIVEEKNIIKNIIIMPSKWFNNRYISIGMYQDIYPKWENLIILDI